MGNTGVRALRPRRGSLRADPLPPLRALRDRPARHLARAVAELRRRPAAGHAPRDPPPRLRPRHHPLRPGQQLRPALRRGGAQLRPHLRRGLQALPRRAHHLDQGGLGHVARAVRRPRLAQVPAGQPGPEPAAHGPGLRRHLLLTPRRPRHAARGDDGRPAQRRRAGQGAVRRRLLLRPPPHARGRAHPARDGHAAAHPPAQLLDDQPLDRGRAARRLRRGGRRRDRLQPAGPGHPHRPLPGRHPRGLARCAWASSSPRTSCRARSTGCARSTRSRPPAARAWPRWPSPGRGATRA